MEPGSVSNGLTSYLTNRLMYLHGKEAANQAKYVVDTLALQTDSLTKHNICAVASSYVSDMSKHSFAKDSLELIGLLKALFGEEFTTYWINNRVPIKEIYWCSNISEFIPLDTNGEDLNAKRLLEVSNDFRSDLWLRVHGGKLFDLLPVASIDSCKNEQDCSELLATCKAALESKR